ncbi:acetylornithine transaminase [Methylonatrum kenyense]|uniref:acetylornithine transaminase n=1 Tax=Methylonatrum kenyense TaxID=455253 RepID=UPI0020BDA919|nr:acetylornithine transaminase [Methylonatrum kenyense]MCK8517286.1 acetylornithine transaminase [Methylonatrum kenyense]
MQTYGRLPVRFVRGEGAWVEDDSGTRYLDGLSGIAVCGLGHAHPAVAAAVAEQARTLVHTSNLYHLPLQEKLAARLCEVSGMDRVFFCNSGAEANEAAIKLARLYGHNRGIDEPRILVLDNAFHGRTMATLTATGNRKAQQGFEPLLPGFTRVPFNDLPAIAAALAEDPSIVAVLLEPVQGEGGVRVPGKGYLDGVRLLCDQHACLMMCDEVQTGIGRTGRWFAFQHNSARPDVLTSAKGLGNGVPIGACLARGAAADTLQPGSHGSTFGGNPLASAAALAVLETLQRERLTERAEQLGRHLLDAFRQELADLPGVRDIRGRGLMLGIELDRPCGELVAEALADQLLINVTAGQTIRLLPPLILSDAEAEQLIRQMVRLVRRFLA